MATIIQILWPPEIQFAKICACAVCATDAISAKRIVARKSWYSILPILASTKDAFGLVGNFGLPVYNRLAS